MVERFVVVTHWEFRTPLWPTKGAFCVLTFLEWFSPLDVTIQCDNMGTIAWCGVSKV